MFSNEIIEKIIEQYKVQMCIPLDEAFDGDDTEHLVDCILREVDIHEGNEVE
jgi:hypothetical protein